MVGRPRGAMVGRIGHGCSLELDGGALDHEPSDASAGWGARPARPYYGGPVSNRTRPAARAVVSPPPTTPTADLYFARAHAAEIAAGRMADGSPLMRHAPGVFSLGDPPDRWVVLRAAPRDLVRTILEGPPRTLAVLLDDDLPAIVRDGSQPLAYRWRQWRGFRHLAPLLDAATHVLAPSPVLLERLQFFAPKASLRSIDPVMPDHVPSSLEHHDADGPLTLLISDTRSHAADVEMAAPSIRAALDADQRLRLLTFLGARAPAALRHPRADHRAPLGWADYQRDIVSLRAHILLAPRRATAVNAARSTSRILDAASVGAVGLYGHVPAIQAAAGPVLPAWTTGDVDWRHAIARLADNPATRLDLARRTGELARTVGSAGRQRTLWTEVLS